MDEERERELRDELSEIQAWLGGCDIDENGDYIFVGEPSELLDAINEAMDREKYLIDILGIE